MHILFNRFKKTKVNKSNNLNDYKKIVLALLKKQIDLLNKYH